MVNEAELAEVQRRWVLVRDALSQHVLATAGTCRCGAFLAGPDDDPAITIPKWDGHLASVALSTLNKAGLLVPLEVSDALV